MSAPNIKNYTTSISAERTISELETILLSFNVSNIMKQAVNGKFTSIVFTVECDNGRVAPFKFCPDIESVAEKLAEAYNNAHSRKRKVSDEFLNEAYNIAWRVQKDMLYSLLSLAVIGSKPMQDLLIPFLLLDEKTTLPQALFSKDGKFAHLLTEHK